MSQTKQENSTTEEALSSAEEARSKVCEISSPFQNDVHQNPVPKEEPHENAPGYIDMENFLSVEVKEGNTLNWGSPGPPSSHLVKLERKDDAHEKNTPTLLDNSLKEGSVETEVNLKCCDKTSDCVANDSNLVSVKLEAEDPSSSGEEGTRRSKRLMPKPEPPKCEKCGLPKLIRSHNTQRCRCKPRKKPDQVYNCPECDYKTKQRKNLTNHSRVHDDRALAFVCSQCDYRTRWRYMLKKHHTKNHDAEVAESAVYGCGECGFKTKSKEYLQRHVSKLHDENAVQHKCPQCDYSTRWKSALKDHFYCRHKDEVFRCTQCGYQTKTQTYLRKHWQRKHVVTGDVHRCDECAYETRYKSNLRVHHRNKHGPASAPREQC